MAVINGCERISHTKRKKIAGGVFSKWIIFLMDYGTCPSGPGHGSCIGQAKGTCNFSQKDGAWTSTFTVGWRRREAPTWLIIHSFTNTS